MNPRFLLIKFVFVFLVTLVFSARSQDVKLPQIVPPSPDAAAIGKFGDIQVSTYTGIPNISIPLYEVKSRDISIPIGLSYHAAGIKVEEEASWVGLGWALNASFAITRTIRGNDDFSTNPSRLGYINSPMPNEPITIAELNLTCLGGIDGLPDVFNFNFMGSSGKFYLKKKASGSDPIRVILDNNDEKISITYDEGAQTWTIINKEGYKGVFNVKEYSRPLSGSVPNPLVGIPVATSWDQYPLVPDIITTWYVDDITSPTGEFVDFVYDNSSYSSLGIASLVEHTNILTAVVSAGNVDNYLFGKPLISNEFDLNTFPPESLLNPISYSGSYQVSFPKYLSKINFSNGEVKFVTSQRNDMQEYTTGSKPRKLDRIEIWNDKVVKSFDFDYVYYNSDAIANTYQLKRLKLNKVTEKGGAIEKKPYLFNYEGDLPNGNNPLPPKNSAARDHWGYYNGKLQNNTGRNGSPSLIPEMNLSGQDGLIANINGADRNSDEVSTKAGVLNKITYPTGGTTEFQYELNSFPLGAGSTTVYNKPYYVYANNTNQVFELATNASVSISAVIKCPTLQCYPPGSGVLCRLNVLNMNELYYRLTNLTTGSVIDSGIYADYLCKQENTCNQGLTSDFCGIRREKTITLTAGKYKIETFPKYGFNIEFALNYKTNYFPSIQQNSGTYSGAGLRVNSITDYDGISISNNIIRKFDYSTKNSDGAKISSGKLMTMPKYNLLTVTTNASEGVSQNRIYVSASSYSNTPLGYSAQGNPVGYDEVKITYGENSENGYSIFSYRNDPEVETEPYLPNAPNLDFSSINGQLKKEQHFSRDGFKTKEVINAYPLFSPIPIETLPVLYTYAPVGCGHTKGWKFTSESSEWWPLIKKTEKIYDLTDPLNLRNATTETDYTYNSNKLISYTATVNSLGEVLKTKYYYPGDVEVSLITPEEMWNAAIPNYKHIHSPVIKQETLVNKGTADPTDITDKATGGVINYYSYHPEKDMVLLNKQDYSLNGAPYETRINYVKYDIRGNILEVQKDKDVTVAYLWSHNGTLPIAQVINAKSDQIFFEGFEADVSIVADPSSAHSGRKFKSTSYTINFSAPPGTYELSYWKYAGSSWTLVKQPYTGSVTLSASRIDDVRVYPVGALMSTYNYDPLLGVLTATDNNNNSTHYTYDELMRLSTIKDLELQPLTKFIYQYKN